MKRLIAVSAVVALLLCGCGGPGRRFVTVGTGSVTGVYYPVGNALCKLLNESDAGIKATAESTGGSVFNVNAIIAGDLEFGMVQSDRQAQAVAGEAEWTNIGPQEKLRAVCSLYTECVTLVATDDSKAENVAGLKDKRVNIGNPGSGNRLNAIETLKAAGLDYEKDLKAEGAKASECAKLLQDGRVDAYFYTVGHPNGSFKEVTAGRKTVHFISITNEVDALLEENPYYARATIPVKYYPNASNIADVTTYGVKATLCTSSDMDEDTVYQLTKSIFEQLDRLKRLHPALEQLEPKAMMEGLSAPLHPGAERYYRESGLFE